MFNFASKMLNTLIGSEENMQGQGGEMPGLPGGPSGPANVRPQGQPMFARPSGPQGPPQGQPRMQGMHGQNMDSRPLGPGGPRGPALTQRPTGSPPGFGPQQVPPGGVGRFPRTRGPPPRGMGGRGPDMRPGMGQGPRMMPRGPGPGPRFPGPNGPYGPRGVGPHPARELNPRMRAMGPPGANMQHLQQSQQGFGPQTSPQQPVPAAPSDQTPVPDVDLSYLSAEERAVIENVMAKAQRDTTAEAAKQRALRGGLLTRQTSQPETGITDRMPELHTASNEPQRRSSFTSGDMMPPRMCAACGLKDVTGREGPPGQPCCDCKGLVCPACARLASNATAQVPIWQCKACFDRAHGIQSWNQKAVSQNEKQESMHGDGSLSQHYANAHHQSSEYRPISERKERGDSYQNTPREPPKDLTSTRFESRKSERSDAVLFSADSLTPSRDAYQSPVEAAQKRLPYSGAHNERGVYNSKVEGQKGDLQTASYVEVRSANQSTEAHTRNAQIGEFSSARVYQSPIEAQKRGALYAGHTEFRSPDQAPGEAQKRASQAGGCNDPGSYQSPEEAHKHYGSRSESKSAYPSPGEAQQRNDVRYDPIGPSPGAADRSKSNNSFSMPKNKPPETQPITYTRPGDKVPCTEFHPADTSLERRNLGEPITEEDEELQALNDDSDEEVENVQKSTGEVYTIQEVEEEENSPTAGDGVTSLRKKAEQQRLLSGYQLQQQQQPNFHQQQQFQQQQQQHAQQQANQQPHLAQQKSQQQQRQIEQQQQAHLQQQQQQQAQLQQQEQTTRSPIPSIRSRFSSLSSLTQPFSSKPLNNSDKSNSRSLSQLTDGQAGQFGGHTSPNPYGQNQSQNYGAPVQKPTQNQNLGANQAQGPYSLQQQGQGHYFEGQQQNQQMVQNQAQNQTIFQPGESGLNRPYSGEAGAQNQFQDPQGPIQGQGMGIMQNQTPQNQSNMYTSDLAQSGSNPYQSSQSQQDQYQNSLQATAAHGGTNQFGNQGQYHSDLNQPPNHMSSPFNQTQNQSQVLMQHNQNQFISNQVNQPGFTQQFANQAEPQNQPGFSQNIGQNQPGSSQTTLNQTGFQKNQGNFSHTGFSGNPANTNQPGLNQNQSQTNSQMFSSHPTSFQGPLNSPSLPLNASSPHNTGSVGLTSIPISPSGVPPPSGLNFGLMRYPGNTVSSQQQQLVQQQQLMQQQQLQNPNSIQATTAAGQAKSGTISGMLADFTRALGLGNTPRVSPSEEKGQQQMRNLSQLQQLDQQHANVVAGQQANIFQHTSNSAFSLVQPHQLQNSLNSGASNAMSILSNPLQLLQSQPANAQQIQQQQLMQMQLEQQQIILQQQLEHLLTLTQQQQMMYAEQMQLQHQAQHLKKLRRSLPHATLEQQQMMLLQQQQIQQQLQSIQQKIPGGHIVIPKPVHPGQLAASKPISSTGYNNTPAAALLHQATVVGDPQKRAYASQFYSDPMTSANALQRRIRTLADGRSLSPNVSPEVEMTFRAGLQGRSMTDSPDTLSETDSQASLRLRRKLPILPPGQDAAPLPTSRRNVNRTPTSQDRMRNFSMRQSSLDGGLFERTSEVDHSYPGLVRPTSETNLKRLASDTAPRPGSALGLLHGANLVSSSGFRTSESAGFLQSAKDSFKESIAAILPPDLRHLVDPTAPTKPADTAATGVSEADSIISEVRRRALEEELKKIEGDRLRIADRERLRKELERYSAIKDPLKRFELTRSELSRRPGGSTGAALASSLARTKRMRGHRRQLSDPRFAASEEESYEQLGMSGVSGQSRVSALRKSFEFESLDDSARIRDELGIRPGAHSVAGITSNHTGYENGLRGLGISGMTRRGSEGGAAYDYYGEMRSRSSLDTMTRQRDPRAVRKPRSWHPSPYGSDEDLGEEDEYMSRDRKQRIKAEIARRRQQIDQNSRLHDELFKVARMRDGNYLTSPRYDVTGVSPPRYSNSPVHLLGSSPTRYEMGASRGPSPARVEEERSMERLASTFREDYLMHFGDRLDYSPAMSDQELTGDFPAMPILPDLPSRSRKILEDLGSVPLQERGHSVDGRRSKDQLQPRKSSLRRDNPRNFNSKQQNRDDEVKSYQETRSTRKALDVRYPFPVKRILLTKEQRENAKGADDTFMGMKMVGGVPIPGSDAEIGSFITEIFPGGLIDTHGEVQRGDQVLEINGIMLTGKSFEEVQSVIASTDGEVELVIRSKNTPWVRPRRFSNPTCKPEAKRYRYSAEYDADGHVVTSPDRQETLGRSRQEQAQRRARSETRDSSPRSRTSDRRSVAEQSQRSSSVSDPPPRDQSQQRHYDVSLERRPYGEEIRKRKWTLPLGQVQLLIVHDSRAHILYVTIIRAKSLQTKRSDGDNKPDAFVRCAMLPGKRSEVTRQTRPFIRCNDPEWQETMVYPGLQALDLTGKSMEITAWHHSATGIHEFLGEFTIDLKDPGIVDEQPHWYQLQETTGLTGNPQPPRARPLDLELNGKTNAMKDPRLSVISKHSLRDTDDSMLSGCSGCTIM